MDKILLVLNNISHHILITQYILNGLKKCKQFELIFFILIENEKYLFWNILTYFSIKYEAFRNKIAYLGYLEFKFHLHGIILQLK